MRVVALISLFSSAMIVASKVEEDQRLALRRNRLYYGVKPDNSVKSSESSFGEVLEEDAFFLGRMLAASFSTPPPSDCDSGCPCCKSSPEFLAAVNGYQKTDSCFTRSDTDGSDIIALDLCETSTLAGFESGLTAYMSVDYANRGGTPTDPVYYCGDSGSDVEFVTQAQGTVCRDVIKSKVEEEGGVCNDVFECTN